MMLRDVNKIVGEVRLRDVNEKVNEVDGWEKKKRRTKDERKMRKSSKMIKILENKTEMTLLMIIDNDQKENQEKERRSGRLRIQKVVSDAEEIFFNFQFREWFFLCQCRI